MPLRFDRDGSPVARAAATARRRRSIHPRRRRSLTGGTGGGIGAGAVAVTWKLSASFPLDASCAADSVTGTVYVPAASARRLTDTADVTLAPRAGQLQAMPPACEAQEPPLVAVPSMADRPLGSANVS